jgi:hypothetical protein
VVPAQGLAPERIPRSPGVLFQPPAGLVTAAVPSDLPVEANGLVIPLGLDHVVLNVRDIDASLPYYHFLYGKEVSISRTIHASDCSRLPPGNHLASNTFASRSAPSIEKPSPQG